MRKALNVYANLRPVAPLPALRHASPLRAELLADVDILFVRELTGGAYFGEKTRGALPEGGERPATCASTRPLRSSASCASPPLSRDSGGES